MQFAEKVAQSGSALSKELQGVLDRNSACGSAGLIRNGDNSYIASLSGCYHPSKAHLYGHHSS